MVFPPEEAGLLVGAELEVAEPALAGFAVAGLAGLADDVEAEVGRAVLELLAVAPAVTPAVAACGCTSQWNGSKLELGSTQDGFWMRR